MKISSVLLGLCLVASCSHAADPKPSSLESSPGMVKWVSFSIPSGWEKAQLLCRDKPIKYSQGKDGQPFAYIAESYFSSKEVHVCILMKGEETKPLLSFSVKPRKFPEEKLKVDARRVQLAPKDLERAIREQTMLTELYMKSADTPYFTEPFKAPLNSVITSIYGTKRVYNKQHRGQHLGTDFRAAIGVPVPVSNRGKVAFAGDLFYTGGTVIVDHGLDIFTVYGHLSEVKTEAGQIVKPGDIIGLSGNSGRSSGPHLHWGVKIQGNYVDGYSLIEESRLHPL